MARSLLVTPTAARVDLAQACLGLVRALDRRGVRVDFVKPVAQPRTGGGPDRSGALVAAISTLSPPEPMSTVDLERQLGDGGLDAALEKVVAEWEPVYDSSDVVIVEGLSPGPTRLYASALNQSLARTLDADVLLVGKWEGRAGQAGHPGREASAATAARLAQSLAIAASGYLSGDDTRVTGCVVSDVPASDPAVAAQLRRPWPRADCGCSPQCHSVPT